MRVCAIVLPLAALLALSACHRGSSQQRDTEPLVQGVSGGGNARSATDSAGDTRQTGLGLNGGLGGSSSGTGLTGTFPAGSVGSSPVAITDGSTDRTTKGSVGNR